MNKARDFLPWIFGALLLASIAVAIIAGSVRLRTPLADPAPSSPAASLTVTPPAAPPLAEPAVLSSVAADSSADPPLSAADAPGPRTSPPSGQIWECTTNGLKTFSNNPCGDKSSLREVGPINTMAATPEVRYVRVNGPDPRYTPASVEENAYADQDAYSEPAAESRDNSYTVIQGFAYLPRRRAEHPHRPIHHYPGMPVRRN